MSASVVPAASRRRQVGLLLLRLLLSAAVLGALFAILPWEDVRTAASRVTLIIYVGALAGFALGHALGAIKWRIMMAASSPGTRLPAAATAGCYGAGLFFNLFLPTVVGGDVVRAGLAARALGRPEAVVAGSVADRLIDFAVLGVLITGGVLAAGAELSGRGAPMAAIAGITAVGAAALLVPLAVRRPLRRWPSRIRRRIGRLLVALRHLWRTPGSAAVAIALSLLMQSLFIVISAQLGHVVGAHAPLWAWFIAWPLAKAAGMLPVSLGGLGVRDAALAAALVPFGVPAAYGVVAGLTWNAVLIGGALAGGVVGWLLGPRRPLPRDATRAERSTGSNTPLNV